MDGRTGGRAGRQGDEHDEVAAASLQLCGPEPYISMHHDSKHNQLREYLLPVIYSSFKLV